MADRQLPDAHNERYHVLTLADWQDGVTWNGHYWPRSYCCTVLETERGPQYSKQREHLTCGHWVNITARFCPHCGRAIVVRV